MQIESPFRCPVLPAVPMQTYLLLELVDLSLVRHTPCIGECVSAGPYPIPSQCIACIRSRMEIGKPLWQANVPPAKYQYIVLKAFKLGLASELSALLPLFLRRTALHEIRIYVVNQIRGCQLGDQSQIQIAVVHPPRQTATADHQLYYTNHLKHV